jgi:hypothetical protein
MRLSYLGLSLAIGCSVSPLQAEKVRVFLDKHPTSQEGIFVQQREYETFYSLPDERYTILIEGIAEESDALAILKRNLNKPLYFPEFLLQENTDVEFRGAQTRASINRARRFLETRKSAHILKGAELEAYCNEMDWVIEGRSEIMVDISLQYQNPILLIGYDHGPSVEQVLQEREVEYEIFNHLGPDARVQLSRENSPACRRLEQSL